VKSASHDALIPQASLLVTHAGHGTAVRAVRHGVPILGLAHGRDQADNAARISLRGARLTLDPSAPADVIRQAASTLLNDPAYAEAAARLGRAVDEPTTPTPYRAGALSPVEGLFFHRQTGARGSD
jgi:UDP:flavonoid glycosyltransferase YjiC (YdhE family)